MEVWEGFNQVLEEIVLAKESKGKMFWSPLASGNHSYKSFREELCINSPSVPIWRDLWRVLASLMVRIFIWLLFRNRVPLKNRLCKF